MLHPRTLQLVRRNLLEFLALGILWWLLLCVILSDTVGPSLLITAILLTSLSKACYFGIENMQQLWQASRENLPYYRYMLLMLMNMSQIATSFALDYHCLHRVNPASFGSVAADLAPAEVVFEFFYFSVLNFTFFGYGDVTPQTVPAKLMTMTEIVLAFVTVIFLLSDFISLKESLAWSMRSKEDPKRRPE